jgi:hypothetical protein
MSIANYLAALDAQRDQLARNLVTMGVQASESEKLNTLVPKVLQIPSGRPEVTLFCNGNDALTTYGESIYTFYIDGYRSIAGFADVYPHFCCEKNEYAIYYNQPDFNWGAVIYTMCITPVRITPASRILLTYKSGWCARAVSRCRLRKRQGISMKSSAAARRSPFRLAGLAPSETISLSCMTAAVYLLTSIILLGRQ